VDECLILVDFFACFEVCYALLLQEYFEDCTSYVLEYLSFLTHIYNFCLYYHRGIRIKDEPTYRIFYINLYCIAQLKENLDILNKDLKNQMKRL